MHLIVVRPCRLQNFNFLFEIGRRASLCAARAAHLYAMGHDPECIQWMNQWKTVILNDAVGMNSGFPNVRRPVFESIISIIFGVI